MPDFISIHNWDKWQSYRKDRGQPPWIKLHRRVMRNPEWVSLSDSERGQLVAMWLLAADHDGVIPASPSLIRKLCFLDNEPDINKFSELGFLDANTTPTRRQVDANTTPTRPTREEKNREEKNKKNPQDQESGKQTFKPAPKKSTPAKSAGISSKNKSVKNSDFSLNLSETFLKINQACEKVLKLPSKKQTKKSSFNPMAWAQKMINVPKHPGAILKCLDGLVLYWDTTGDPWGYCTDNLKKYNGNFNEQEAIAIHEDLKNNYNENQLSDLTAGLIKGF